MASDTSSHPRGQKRGSHAMSPIQNEYFEKKSKGVREASTFFGKISNDLFASKKDPQDGNTNFEEAPTNTRNAEKRSKKAANSSTDWKAKYEANLPALERARDENIRQLTATDGWDVKYADCGIHVHGIGSNRANTGQVAGYLNLEDRAQFCLLQEALANPFAIIRDLEKTYFGIRHDRTVPKLCIDRMYRETEVSPIAKADIESDDEPHALRFPTDSSLNRRRAYLWYLRWVRHMMAAVEKLRAAGPFPQVFTGPHVPERSFKMIEGMDWEAEDINRALIFFRLWTSRDIMAKKGSNRAVAYAGSPILPIFHVPGATTTNGVTLHHGHRNILAEFTAEMTGVVTKTLGPVEQLDNGTRAALLTAVHTAVQQVLVDHRNRREEAHSTRLVGTVKIGEERADVDVAVDEEWEEKRIELDEDVEQESLVQWKYELRRD